MKTAVEGQRCDIRDCCALFGFLIVKNYFDTCKGVVSELAQWKNYRV